jgi:hypothetical protein
MNAISTFFASHKLSAHITMASILAAFGTVFTLWQNVPQFKAELLLIYASMPSWLAGLASCAVMVVLFYYRSSSPASVVAQAQVVMAKPDAPTASQIAAVKP